jgi:hypothetical protein
VRFLLHSAWWKTAVVKIHGKNSSSEKKRWQEGCKASRSNKETGNDTREKTHGKEGSHGKENNSIKKSAGSREETHKKSSA